MEMNMRFLLIPILLFSSLANAEGKVAMPLKYSTECILQAVAMKKHISLRPEIAVPPVFVESKVPLKQFQDAIEPQWHLRPDSFLNAYIFARNEIYLLDDLEYYQKHERYIDDSLAHELTHYVQVMYQHADLNEDDSLEGEAIDVQTWFREEFMKTGKSPCAK
jgi:hypothetical protein